jgi:hypothetical protein
LWWDWQVLYGCVSNGPHDQQDRLIRPPALDYIMRLPKACLLMQNKIVKKDLIKVHGF